MEYKETYFESGPRYNRDRGFYRLRKSLSKDFVNRKSEDHYRFILLEKWKFLNGCEKILDAGCGKGQFIELNPYRAEVLGVDVLKNEIDEARKKKLNVQVADITKKLPFKDETFDGIICSHVLEHLTEPEKMLNEFRRVLKKEGRVVIAVPNFSFKRFYNDPTHKRPYPKEALFRILSDHGFREVQIKKGPHLNQFISALFFLMPRTRHFFEKILGKINPWEIIAIAKK